MLSRNKSVICIDARPLIEKGVSGVGIYTRNIIHEMVRKNPSIRFVLWINGFSLEPNNLHEFIHYKNVITCQTGYSNKLLNVSLSLFGIPKINRLIRAKTGETISHFFMPEPRPYALDDEIKLILTIHDLSPIHFPYFYSLKTRIWHKLVDIKKIIKKADKLIAVSDYTKEDIKTLIKPAGTIKKIYEGVPCDLSLDYRPGCINKYHLKKPYFLFLATLEPRKNLSNLIRGFDLFKQRNHTGHKLVLAGQMNSTIFAKMNLPKHPDIFFPGHIAEEDKAALYAHAEAFVYPSFFEGFGLALLEAMHYETPIITSNRSSMPEICLDAAIYIDPESPESIAFAFSQILDQNVATKLIQKAKERVKQFSWEKAARETIAYILS